MQQYNTYQDNTITLPWSLLLDHLHVDVRTVTVYFTDQKDLTNETH